MSLHLLESRKSSRVIALRRPGASLASVALHAALGTVVVIATTSSRMTTATRPDDSPRLTYMEPPRVHLAAAPAAATAAATVSTTSLSAPSQTIPFVAPLEIPSSIPVSTDLTSSIVYDFDRATPASPGVGVRRGLSGNGGTGDGGAPFDALSVDRPVLLLPGSPVPKYPEAMRLAGVGDTLVASFVVGVDGRVETGSLAFAGSPRAEFVSAVRASLMRARFKPAEAEGRVVRQRVTQPFVFSLN